jgi:hypothetical protein
MQHLARSRRANQGRCVLLQQKAFGHCAHRRLLHGGYVALVRYIALLERWPRVSLAP